MSNSIDKPKKVASVKKNKKSTKNATKSSKKAVDESSNKTVDCPDTKPIKKAIDESFDNPSKKIKENNANVSNKTDHELSDSQQLKEEDKLNLSNKKTDDVYKLKISKNSIKMKNIESIYPNNIGVEETKTSFLVLYKNAKTAKKDLRINEKYKFYNDKLIISNFSYKENEESIKKFLSDLGEVVDISLEKNKDDVFTGKAVVTFESSVKIDKELKLNNKILRVERIRKQVVNDKRIFIGRIDMNLSIMDIRKVIKEAGARITDVRIRYEKDTHKNIGYGHLSFKTREDAVKFENSFQNIKKTLGPHSFYEYAKEKFMGPRKK
ncbi:RNA-binding protein Musashi like protein 1 [Nosema bombycis CQ1]|uniref:RNA-binding protein Musashi like protein 1 n=1 Tax=Nosema bombycis (strain CQ1 / CVCC 102059) TaxID=578461 RepID=R0M8F0_NOSB1|nr:RNA-binding protein Musashi like protein 1 [Nosema bombycis CQ1]|eukprot:EOB14254.1 RNA-binding protein Musashi like protein 1 [Nosema bombycis CQ1]